MPLSETGLRQEKNILIMLIEKPREKAHPASARTVFDEGDTLTVFGNYRIICHVFQAKEHFTDF